MIIILHCTEDALILDYAHPTSPQPVASSHSPRPDHSATQPPHQRNTAIRTICYKSSNPDIKIYWGETSDNKTNPSQEGQVRARQQSESVALRLQPSNYEQHKEYHYSHGITEVAVTCRQHWHWIQN